MGGWEFGIERGRLCGFFGLAIQPGWAKSMNEEVVEAKRFLEPFVDRLACGTSFAE